MQKKPSRSPSRRQLRVGEQIRHILFEVFRHNQIYQDLSTTGIITISEVRMSPDLRVATVFISALNSTYSNEAILKKLKDNSRLIRGLVSPSLRQMKHMPELRFRWDESYESMAHIDSIFQSSAVKRDLNADILRKIS